MTAATRSASSRSAADASRAANEPRLSVEQVSYAYAPNPQQAPIFTLEATSFHAKAGEVVAILGPNASGKSTLLQIISGALQPLSGRVLLNGFVTHELEPRIRGQRIAMVQQESVLLFPSKAWEFVMQGRHPYGKSLRFETDDDVMIARNALAQVGAEHLSDRRMDQISGGEKQRVILARWPNSLCCCCSMNLPCIWTSERRWICLRRCSAWRVKIAIRSWWSHMN
jgi:iron complex transport system ATP-binding protein